MAGSAIPGPQDYEKVRDEPGPVPAWRALPGLALRRGCAGDFVVLQLDRSEEREMASRPEQLYEEDFYAWTRDQAQALRRLAASRPNLALDFPHLIEEVADLGNSQRDAARSHLRRIIEHCLKLEYSPAQAPRAGWHETIVGARIELEDKLTLSLRRGLQRRLPRLYDQARRSAEASLRVHGEDAAADALPAECPYRLADLLRHAWHPASRHGHAP